MDFIITTILSVFVIALFYKYFSINSKKGNSLLRGPVRLPFVGSALLLNPKNLHGQFVEFAKQFGNMFEIQIFDTTNIVLNTSELIHKAFKSDEYKGIFHNRPVFHAPTLAIGRRNITFRDWDESHSLLRKYLSRGLNASGNGLTPFEDIMKTEISRVTKEIENTKGVEVELMSLSRRSVCNIMSILLIGEIATENDVRNYFDLIEGLDFYMDPLTNLLVSKIPLLRYLPVFKYNFGRIQESYSNIMDKTFYQTKTTWTAGKCRGIVDWYLEEQQNQQSDDDSSLTDDVIKGMIFDFLTAGIVTTATMFPCVMLCLVNHPEYQRKVQEEIDKVIGADREPVAGDKIGCHFLQAAILETFRLLTPVPFLLPHVSSEDAEFDGHFVKKNTQILTNAWYIHHNESFWNDPWIFRPERFLNNEGMILPSSHENIKNWIPFGIGRRKCPGMHLATTLIFLYISSLMQKCSFTPAPGKHVSHDPRTDDFEFHFLLRLKKFYCIPKERQMRF